jgi:hypothetical protein
MSPRPTLRLLSTGLRMDSTNAPLSTAGRSRPARERRFSSARYERVIDALGRQRNAFEATSHENAGTLAPVALTSAAGTLVP